MGGGSYRGSQKRVTLFTSSSRLPNSPSIYRWELEILFSSNCLNSFSSKQGIARIHGKGEKPLKRLQGKGEVVISPSMNRGVKGSSRDETSLCILTVQRKIPFPNIASPSAKGQSTKGHMSLYSAILYKKASLYNSQRFRMERLCS